jgi:hypothetical protein
MLALAHRTAPLLIAVNRLLSVDSGWVRACVWTASIVLNGRNRSAHARPSDMSDISTTARCDAHGTAACGSHPYAWVHAGADSTSACRDSFESAATTATATFEDAGLNFIPLPAIPRGAGMRVFRGKQLALIADYICERGWRGRGVRVFAWPCGTLVVVNVGSGPDEALLKQCIQQLLGTYARHGDRDPGPIYLDVLRELREARAA